MERKKSNVEIICTTIAVILISLFALVAIVKGCEQTEITKRVQYELEIEKTKMDQMKIERFGVK